VARFHTGAGSKVVHFHLCAVWVRNPVKMPIETQKDQINKRTSKRKLKTNPSQSVSPIQTPNPTQISTKINKNNKIKLPKDPKNRKKQIQYQIKKRSLSKKITNYPYLPVK
jgi:hypothetical protein